MHKDGYYMDTAVLVTIILIKSANFIANSSTHKLATSIIGTSDCATSNLTEKNGLSLALNDRFDPKLACQKVCL